MSVRSAQSVTIEFTTQRFDTGAATNADSLPVGTLVKNGTDDAASVTVTNIDAGRYKAAVTLPTLAAGDIVELSIAATVNSVAGKAIVWRETKDLALDASYRPGIDWSNVGAPTTSLALTGTTIATTQQVDVNTIKTQTVTCAAGVTVGAFVGNATAALSVNASGRIDVGLWLGVAPLALSSQQVQAVVPITQKVDIETIKTNPVVNAGTVTFPTNATLASTSNITAAAGVVLSATGTDLVLVAGKTLPNAVKYIGATVAGVISGAGTGTEVFKDFANATAITVTVDASGNRSSVIYA